MPWASTRSGSISTFSALFVCSYASSITRTERVAEKSIVWRRWYGGQRRRIRRRSRMNPMSNMRSASSITRISTWRNDTAPCCS